MVKFTDNELTFLKENYPKYGSKYCSLALNRSQSIIRQRALKLGISGKDSYPHPSTQTNFKFDMLENPTKEFIYFLGYMWADGSICQVFRPNSNKGSFSVRIEISSDDYNQIESIFESFITFSKYERKRNKNWKQTSVCGINNKYLFEFLDDLGFKNKSLGIQNVFNYCDSYNMGNYFILGYFDGDGYSDFSKVLQWCGPYDTDWTTLEDFFKTYNINTGIYRHTTNKGHKYSEFKIQNRFGINWFINNILPDNNFGLSRKRPTLGTDTQI